MSWSSQLTLFESFHWYAAIVCNADKLLPDTTTQSSTSVNTQPTKEEAFAAATQDDPATPDKTPRTLRHDPSTIERRTSQMSLDDEKPPQGPFQIYEDVAEGLDSSKSSVHTEQHKPGRGKKAGPDE